MTVIINNLTYAPATGPADELIVDEIVGSFPVASGQEAIALNAALIDTGSATVPQLYASTFAVSKADGAVSILVGSLATAEAVDASVTHAEGLRGRVLSTGTGSILDGSAFAAMTPTIANSGTITNAFGVRIEPQAQSGIGQAWAIYALGTSDPSALAGTLSVGSLNVPQAALDVTGAIRSIPVTVATLPASPVDGMRAFVTDATHSTFAAAVAGSGASHVPVYYDGGSSVWRIG
jgi:hypothetical protein